jgi:hypothetical protein
MLQGVREYARQRSVVTTAMPVHRSASFNRTNSISASYTDNNSVSQVGHIVLAKMEQIWLTTTQRLLIVVKHVCGKSNSFAVEQVGVNQDV